ncbi:MAG: ATP-dependent RNA helicase HrpA [Motiliproteus sp.]|nr:ATP-dependent RNA helicase HrpA [Motiliproteus sp.]MCW9051616.1 ATP-dependent RNA helicase HrpA [Motiliproteus sp.]
MNSSLKQLAAELENCLLSDRQELQKILAAIKRNAAKGKPFDRLQSKFQQRVQQSIGVVEKRQGAPLHIRYDDNLPIADKRQQILELIKKHQVVVLAGETGSGKTTQLPKLCLELGRGVFGVIGHTQPRRLAARAVASRIAEELSVELGSLVGYQVRFSDALSDQSRVKLMTDGILLAEIQHDPLLLRYDTLIIDEAHERSLNIDFLLGYLKRLLPKRPDLKLIITSATIDLERFARHFDAPVIEVSGRTYPVELIYSPLDEMTGEDEKDLDLQQAIVRSISDIEQLERQRNLHYRGDVLVFLSGERDIRETADALRKQQFRDTEILPLYARLSQSEQNRIFHPNGRGRRIVLATNVAETSLTVPGIRYVVDPGFARISRYSYRSKVQRLPIEAISQASANQRKGRCGRVSEGICIRLFSEDDYNSRPGFTDAEILRTNLAAVILQMEGLKLGRVEDFPFIDPPDPRFIKDGIRLLQELGALNKGGGLTAIGRQLSKLPVDPRIGRMIVEAKNNSCLSEVLVIASALSVQDPRERPLDKQQQSDEKHRQHQDPDSDFIGFLNLWNLYEEQRQSLSNSQLRSYCKKQFLAFMRMREWRDLHRQLHLACKDLGFKENSQPAGTDAIHKSLLAGLLGNIGLKQENREYLGARNRKFVIFPGSVLAKSKGNKKWIMAAELVETSRLFARVVAKIEPHWIEPLAKHLVNRNYSEPHWEKRAARVVAYEQQTLYGLAIVSKRKVHFGTIEPEQSQQIFVRSALVEGDYSTNAPFFNHNRQLLKEVEALEDKSRRKDILVDEEQLYEFYRQLLIEQRGDEVVNGASFEQWRKKLEQQDPKALFISKEQLMQHDAATITEEKYPDNFNWQGMEFRLSYHFEPGTENDGVTISVPAVALNRLPHKRLQWLVPGMLKDKCIALLKGLPKNLRKNFVPISDYVDAFMDRASSDDIELTEALALSLRKMTGVRIPEASWKEVVLDEHHLINYQILDVEGKTLLVGRDWQALSQRCSADSQTGVREKAHPIERNRIEKWDFGELPFEVQVQQAGMKLELYSAVTYDGKDIAVRLFDNPLEAEIEHRQGVRQLLWLQIHQKIKVLRKDLSGWNHIALMYSGIGSENLLWRDFIAAIINRAFLSGSEPPRNYQAFQRCLEQGRFKFHETAIELFDLLKQVLESYRRSSKRLSGKVSLDSVTILNDIRTQLEGLLIKGFLEQTPPQWLTRYPIYLQGIECRLDKFARDINQQRIYSEQLGQLQNRYFMRMKQPVLEENTQKCLIQYRWMLEEYRISLFAQNLGTVCTVSTKRLDKLWNSCSVTS